MKSIAQRTFEQVSFECEKDIDMAEVEILSGAGEFVAKVLQASKQGWCDYGTDILCVHTDADNKTSAQTYQHKIDPAKEALSQQNDKYCKIMVAIILVQETEAWLLADIDLLKEEMLTKLSSQDLGFIRSPEGIANPKELIKKALENSNEKLSKKKRVEMATLYLPIGQAIDLEKLDALPS